MLPDVPSPGTANAPPPQPDAASVAAPSGASIELGAGLRGVPFVPGRYATVIHRRLSGTHARQLVRETSSAPSGKNSSVTAPMIPVNAPG